MSVQRFADFMTKAFNRIEASAVFNLTEAGDLSRRLFGTMRRRVEALSLPTGQISHRVRGVRCFQYRSGICWLSGPRLKMEILAEYVPSWAAIVGSWQTRVSFHLPCH